MVREKANPLEKWLEIIDRNQPERAYLPDLRDFLAGVLEYPKSNVQVEQKVGGGFPDLALLTKEKCRWVVGDFKKDDSFLSSDNGREKLWRDKSKYVEGGLTRYVLFLTPRFIWVVLPTGETVCGPICLEKVSLNDLQKELGFLSWERASHLSMWQELCSGQLPYSYINLFDELNRKRLQDDLTCSFSELESSAKNVFMKLRKEYLAYKEKMFKIDQSSHSEDVKSRLKGYLRPAHNELIELFEISLPSFVAQYGRIASGKTEEQRYVKTVEAFIADSVAVLISRILFLRLAEDMGLIKKRRLTNGGPKNWVRFVEMLASDTKALIQIVSRDVAKLYAEPFSKSVFDWIMMADGELDVPLQKLILRLNAYNFATLDAEFLGDIYQQFLPEEKRKALGEYYTPVSIVDWLLNQSIGVHRGAILDPSCGSGSFLVRYIQNRINDADKRGLSPEIVRRELLEDVYGFDINPFATFISHFQIFWALLRLSRQTPRENERIHIYHVDALKRDSDFISSFPELLPEGIKVREEKRFDYVVGNPPYIRAERLKDGAQMRLAWEGVWGQNADTGIIFIYRALTEWLKPGGTLAMVVSAGYANAEAAKPVLRLMEKVVTLKKLVWLEFAGKVWESSVVPMLMVIEKRKPSPDDEIELYVPSKWPDPGCVPTRVKYKDFFCCGKAGLASDSYSYILPFLKNEDIPLLKKLDPGINGNYVALGYLVDWTYGIQRGGVELSQVKEGERSIPVIAGRSLAVAWPGTATGWVDLEMVKKRPNGKLSLWKNWPREKIAEYIAVPLFVLAPCAAVVRGDVACLDTIIVGKLKNEDVQIGFRTKGITNNAIGSYLNSSIVRYLTLVKWRAGVLGGGPWLHMYPRTLMSLPWRKNAPDVILRQLDSAYEHLSSLAQKAKDSVYVWFDLEVKKGESLGKKRKLSESDFGINFRTWGKSVGVETITVEGQYLKGADDSKLFVQDEDLSLYAYILVKLRYSENGIINIEDLQELPVVENYREIVREYRQKEKEQADIERQYVNIIQDIDQLVAEMLGLEEKELKHIHCRLNDFPLNLLKPRYPWSPVVQKPVKAYTEDRFR